MLGKAQIIAHDFVGDPLYKIRRLVLRTEIAREAQPGQFVHVQVTKGIDPLLRRPISIADIQREAQEITLLYRIKGRGTEILSEAKVGEELSLMGPLGRGFTLPTQGELILVAGGIGVFPLLPLAKAAQEKSLAVSLYWGGENEGFFTSSGLELWQEAGIPVFLSTMDGSIGEKGNVLDLIQKQVESRVNHGKDAVAGACSDDLSVAVCGPQVMTQVVSDYFLLKGASVEVSLEERMGCAVGACLGCVCTLRDEVSGRIYRGKVCKDGPVFKGKEVLWDYEQ
ncbi:2-polyprenylphenol hydroxylase-like oxidoreductase [Desulfitobacterium dichloroeliminans LMG P-21439]|uniref:2-polyprenylphenol hydroxylase-like oxidoreductase n=1 Tax=Desulfitobacterium dichloroeliminans (strain LMG P-21439 / DCA1) TaxID=871963 RepID=L0FB60_DESDL|nr:dihydroorotate dehydrogenase electron transfer subunit [Desulfitobacterium dichloroeliminans]AGA70178.1 2-polyprenylphenol hydroxylase-like oxidoreductase [Desulfitobacterium dichloroeliminans LMG P-21439]